MIVWCAEFRNKSSKVFLEFPEDNIFLFAFKFTENVLTLIPCQHRVIVMYYHKPCSKHNHFYSACPELCNSVCGKPWWVKTVMTVDDRWSVYLSSSYSHLEDRLKTIRSLKLQQHPQLHGSHYRTSLRGGFTLHKLEGIESRKTHTKQLTGCRTTT